MSKQQDIKNNEDNLIPIDYSFDAQWDKSRGFNSLIGGGAVIGKLLEKVIIN